MEVLYGTVSDIDEWMKLVERVAPQFPGLETICCLAVSPEYRRCGIASALLEKALAELDRSREITVSTYREDDEKGVAPRALYKKYGFVEGELNIEFDYPNQKFVLFPQEQDLFE